MKTPLKLKTVWVADNGDIFLEREMNFEKHTKEEVKALKEQALEALDRGEVKPCHYEPGEIKWGKYYTSDGEFLGNEQIHVLTHYCMGQEFMYLHYQGKLTPWY